MPDPHRLLLACADCDWGVPIVSEEDIAAPAAPASQAKPAADLYTTNPDVRKGQFHDYGELLGSATLPLLLAWL